MDKELTDLYCDWLADQNLVEMLAFEEQQEIFKEILENLEQEKNLKSVELPIKNQYY